MMLLDNRRRHARYPLPTPVVLVAADGQVASFRARDVSAGGVYLFAPSAPGVGTPVQVELMLGSRERFRAAGVVVRTEQGKTESGFAVQFRELDRAIERRLEIAIAASADS